MTSLEGAILAGGKSRRMGRDKALLPIAGRPMLERVAASLGPLVQRLRVVGGSSELPARLDLESEPDLRPGLGPLSGLHTALAAAEADAVLVVACDLPRVTTEALEAIARHLGELDDASVPVGPEGPIPVCAVYRRRCLPALESYLDGGGRSARGFLERIRVAWVDESALAGLDPERAFLNVNSPEDYEEAVSLAEAEAEAEAEADAGST